MEVILRRLGFALLVFQMACSGAHDDAEMEVADEYRMPYAIRQVKLKMYYAVEPVKDTLVVEVERFSDDSAHYERQVSLVKSTGVVITRSTMLLTEHGTRLLEAESFREGKLIHDKIVLQRALPRGPRKYSGVEVRRERDVSAFDKVITTAVETFDRDTVFEWQGQSVPSLKFKTSEEEVTVNRFFPWLKSTRHSQRFGLFSKGIGYTYTRMNVGDAEMTFKLARIEVIEPARE